MKQETAVDYLWHELIANPGNYIKAYKQAKEMEKQQIIDAFESGVYDGGENVSQYNMNSEQYYNEQYGK